MNIAQHINLLHPPIRMHSCRGLLLVGNISQGHVEGRAHELHVAGAVAISMRLRTAVTLVRHEAHRPLLHTTDGSMSNERQRDTARVKQVPRSQPYRTFYI